eukprot:1161439-Pelagomonas_calceolata.AAC.15
MRVERSLLKSASGARKFISVLDGMGMKLQSKPGGCMGVKTKLFKRLQGVGLSYKMKNVTSAPTSCDVLEERSGLDDARLLGCAICAHRRVHNTGQRMQTRSVSLHTLPWPLLDRCLPLTSLAEQDFNDQATREHAVHKTLNILQHLQEYVDSCMLNVEEHSQVLVSPGAGITKRKRPSGEGELKQQAQKHFEDHMLPGTPTQVKVLGTWVESTLGTCRIPLALAVDGCCASFKL